MLKKLILMCAIWSFVFFELKADHTPMVSGNYEREYEVNYSLFIKQNRLNYFLNMNGHFEGTDQEFRYHSFIVGPYYRFFKNLKGGLFYTLQRGERHDDDWIVENGTWKWKDSTEREEQLVKLDLTPKIQLHFLPGENWVLSVKNRLIYNFYNENKTFTTKSGLTYFFIDGGEPIFNIFFNYEVYIPLNYGTSNIYKEWLYAGGLYHFSSNTKLSFYGAIKRVTWSSSEDFERTHPGEDYKVKYKAYVLGFSIINIL